MADCRADLMDLVAEFEQRSRTRICPSFGPRLAHVLKWRKEDHFTRTETIRKRGFPYPITQVSLGEQPALFFVSHQHAKSEELISQVALCAYHSAIEWGVVTNFSETVVFNSHWVKNGEWFRFPTIPYTQLVERVGLFDALTPEGMREGRIQELADSESRPDHILVPVDDQLVESLDAWRDEALCFSESHENVDARLQHLFAQLFVLRAVEDRRLAPRISRLSSCIKADGRLNIPQVKRIFREARNHIQSELFEVGLPEDIPERILKGVIEDLYRPRDFPIVGVRYNFSWIEADVLGQAYEKYLSSVLIPSRHRDPQLLLFDPPLRDVQRVSRRKAGGVYYTPEYIVRYLTERTLDSYFASTVNSKSQQIPRLVDPSCGSGSFLRAAADSLIRRLSRKSRTKNWGRELIRKRAIVGIDVDMKAVTLARLSLWLRLAEEPKPLPLPSLNKNIVCGDALEDATWKGLPEDYDIVLGNPPFLAATEAQLPRSLKSRFRSAQGRFDSSSLFVEQAIGKLKQRGYLGYVIPNRLFRNTYAAGIRGLITETMSIQTLVDFGSTEVFSGTSTYIGLILAQKDSDTIAKSRVRVIQVRSLPLHFPGAVLASGNMVAPPTMTYFKAFDAHHPNGEAPWNLLSDKAMQVRMQLQGDNPSLESVAIVAQGIKTGANDIFVVGIVKSLGSGLCIVVNGLGHEHCIEEALLRPVVYGSEIQRYDVVRPERFVIYPYSLDIPIPENDFRRQYLRTYEYLRDYRDLLSVRSGIQDKPCLWYELVRKRQSRWLDAKKILIRELATYPCFALDARGGTYLIGGTAIIPQDPPLLEPLLAFLNSRLCGWYLDKSSRSFRGGYNKFEPNAIQDIPVPERLIKSGTFRVKVSREVREILIAHSQGDEKRQRHSEDMIDRLFSSCLEIPLDEID